MMFNVKTLNRPYNKNSALIGNTFIYFLEKYPAALRRNQK